jgi:hypothetical protein
MELPVETYCHESCRATGTQRYPRSSSLGRDAAATSAVTIEMDRLGMSSERERKTSPCQTCDTAVSSCVSWAFRGIASAMRSIVPRRLDEPTGPFELVRLAAPTLTRPLCTVWEVDSDRRKCARSISKLFDVLIGLFVARGASKRNISTIPTREFDEEDACECGSRCAVCLGDYIVGERVRHLPCTHTFHNDCVDP